MVAEKRTRNLEYLLSCVGLVLQWYIKLKGTHKVMDNLSIMEGYAVNLTLLGLGLIKINTVLANSNNPRP